MAVRIACFHLNQIGDLAFSLPALKCLGDGFPGARITSVVRPPAREVLECTGVADEVLARSGGLNLRKIRLARDLADRHFDLAVVFSQSAECALLGYLTRASRRIGFVNTSLGWLLTERVDFRHPPSTQNNLRLIEAVGCEITRTDYAGLLTPSADMMARGERILLEHGVGRDDRIIGLAPGTSGRRRLKEWTDSGFAEVAKCAIGKGLKVVVLGTTPKPGIVNECPETLDLGGKTSLADAVGILARCDALVAVDSGMLHLYAALGKPVVGLYGPSDLAVTGPQGTGHVVLTSGAECSPCGQGECKLGQKCMTDIDPADVNAAMEVVLGGAVGASGSRTVSA